MRAKPRRGSRRSFSEPPRRGGFAKPRVGPVGAGILAVLAGFPVLAQVGAFPPAEPGQEESLPPTPTETEPAPDGTAPPTGAPAEPISPFGLSPDIFPGLLGGRPPRAGTPAEPASPFGLSPDIFPGLLGGRPDRRTFEQPAIPSETGEPDFSTAPAGDQLETPPPPEALAPTEPEPGFAGSPDFGFPDLASPFGFGNAGLPRLLPPNPAPTEATENPVSTTSLGPLRPGALPVQAYDPRAPRILIRPTVSAFAGLTDNALNTPNGSPDVFARLHGGTTISVDTVRLQGQLSGGLDYLKYAHNSQQDSLNANLLAYGLGTVVQDHIFIDGRAAITQTSRTGALGFANPNLLPNSDQTQVITASVTPIARASLGGYVDGELRYNHSIAMFQRGNFLQNANAPAVANLSDATSNEVTAIAATGRLFSYYSSRLTLDARKIDSASASRSTQYRAYDNLEYHFNQKFAGLARFGYESLDFPLQPSASFTGPTWSLGARYTPFQGSYLIANYGRQEGQLGFSGALRYEVTPRTIVLASYARNRASQAEQILNNLNSSGVDNFGNVVNQVTGVPGSLVNPQLSLNSNAIFQFNTARAGLQTQLDRNSLSLFGFYVRRSQLGEPIANAGIAAGDTARGVNFSWSRLLTPLFSSQASLGYASATSANQKTLTASLSMTYALGEKLTAILHYQFINVDSSAVGSSYQRNQVEIGLTRSF